MEFTGQPISFRGRPITVDVRSNPTYFKDYYHAHNKQITCECGCVYKKQSKAKHITSKKHAEILGILAKNNNPEN